jgi:hypothetical protein
MYEIDPRCCIVCADGRRVFGHGPRDSQLAQQRHWFRLERRIGAMLAGWKLDASHCGT